jgi:cholesterol transport system auxiliary component
MSRDRVTRLIALTGFAALSGACSLGPAPRAPVAGYDLGAPPETGAGAPGRRLPFVFIVHEASGPPWLDGGDMVYRLAYDEPARLRHYANSQWAVSPLTLVSERLRARLAARCERAAAVPDLGIPADYRVRVAVDELGQVFDSPGAAHAVVRLRVVLVKGRGHAFLGQKEFVAQVASESPDARGGVAALGRALEESVGQAVAWIVEVVGPEAKSDEAAR